MPTTMSAMTKRCGSPTWIRTTINGSKGRCPTVRRSGNKDDGPPPLLSVTTARYQSEYGVPSSEFLSDPLCTSKIPGDAVLPPIGVSSIVIFHV